MSMSAKQKKLVENLLKKEGITDAGGNLVIPSAEESEGDLFAKLDRMYAAAKSHVTSHLFLSARWIRLLQQELVDARAVAKQQGEQLQGLRSREARLSHDALAAKTELEALKNAKVDEAQVELRVKARLFDQMFGAPPAESAKRLFLPGHPIHEPGGRIARCPGCGSCRPLGTR